MDVAIHKSFNALQLVPGDHKILNYKKIFWKYCLKPYMSSWALRWCLLSHQQSQIQKVLYRNTEMEVKQFALEN